jgi:hypothetical protein
MLALGKMPDFRRNVLPLLLGSGPQSAASPWARLAISVKVRTRIHRGDTCLSAGGHSTTPALCGLLAKLAIATMHRHMPACRQGGRQVGSAATASVTPPGRFDFDPILHRLLGVMPHSERPTHPTMGAIRSFRRINRACWEARFRPEHNDPHAEASRLCHYLGMLGERR